MTQQDWFDGMVAKLENILLHGYFTDNRDPSNLFRKMENDVRRLRECVAQGWVQAQPDYKPAAKVPTQPPAQPKPQPQNGQAAQPVRR